jgi:ABC-type phosphate transport system substrate-binding protein
MLGGLCALPPSPPPAPLVEVARRDELTTDGTAIAVGQAVAHIVDRAVLAAFAESVGTTGAPPIACSDRDAMDLLSVGKAELGFTSGILAARDQRAGVRAERIGVELFALTVAPGMPVQSLTRHQVRQVLTGAVTHWHQLGFEGGAIVPIVPSDRGEADRAARALIAGDSFASTCLRVASERHVVDQLLREPGAIGVVRVTSAPREGEQRLVAIDWQPPTLAAFDAGSYPFGMVVQLVTVGPAVGTARRFAEFASSAAGHEVLGRRLSLPQ